MEEVIGVYPCYHTEEDSHGYLRSAVHHARDAAAQSYFADEVFDILGVPKDAGWFMHGVVAMGYPTGTWGLGRVNGFMWSRRAIAGTATWVSQCRRHYGRNESSHTENITGPGSCKTNSTHRWTQVSQRSIKFQSAGYILLGIAMFRNPAFGKGLGGVTIALALAGLVGIYGLGIDSIMFAPLGLFVFILLPILLGWKVYSLA